MTHKTNHSVILNQFQRNNPRNINESSGINITNKRYRTNTPNIIHSASMNHRDEIQPLIYIEPM